MPVSDSVDLRLDALGFGQVLGRYTLIRRVAVGGMAEVYSARANASSGVQKRVAIKKILPQLSHNERFVEMLVDEAKITVSLAHQNIAQVFELAVDGDYFLVMEYVDGPPLAKLIGRSLEKGLRAVPPALAVYIISEVAKGLDHAHKQLDGAGKSRSIVHRDISPQNILISYQGGVKLIDFGIARAAGRAARTAHGIIKGKLRYLAPEIANGEEPDGRADLYCCGVVLFEALTGVPMFAPSSDVEAVAMAAAGATRSPRSVKADIPSALDAIVMRAVSYRREDRYQTGKELSSDLRIFLHQHYPEFIESDLGDFVSTLFAAEREDERALDTAADRRLRGPSQTCAFIEDRPLIGDVHFGDRPTYKRLVSALGSAELAAQEPATELPDETAELFYVLTGESESIDDVFSSELPSMMSIPPERPARKAHCDVQSDLTELGTGEHRDSSLPGLLYGTGELSFSEEIIIEDTAPSLPRMQPLSAELTDWRPKRFRAWRSKSGSWSLGQLVAILVLFAIGGVSLAVAVSYDRAYSKEETIVIRPHPTVVDVPISLHEEKVEEVEDTPKAVEPVLAVERAEKPNKSKNGLVAIRVKSSPASSITVDGKKKGRTPKTLWLKPGSHNFVLEGPGGERRAVSRYLGRGKNLPISEHW